MSDKKAITLKAAADAYLEHLGKNGTKETTVKVYRRSLDLAITHFGADRKLSGIMIPHAGKYFASDLLNKHDNGKPKAEPTIKQNKRVFRQCLEFAKEQGMINVLPIPKSEMQHARGMNTSKDSETPKSESTKKETA